MPLLYSDGLRLCPNPETADAFAKLTAARANLAEVTKQLNEAHNELQSGGQEGRARHMELQTQCDEAYRAFEAATDEFSATVKQLPNHFKSYFS